MSKQAKIDDIKGPDKVSPPATARPVIVGNRPTLTKDPMMAPDDAEKKEEAPAETLNHTAKIIAPISVVPAEPAEAAETSPTEPDAPEPKVEAEPDAAELPVEAIEEDNGEETAAAEAKAKRETELEEVIESGKYAVPINAVQRKRSRVATLLLCMLAVVLLVVLLDVVADVGIIKLPSSVPHTHFFSKNTSQ